MKNLNIANYDNTELFLHIQKNKLVYSEYYISYKHRTIQIYKHSMIGTYKIADLNITNDKIKIEAYGYPIFNMELADIFDRQGKETSICFLSNKPIWE